MTDPTSLPNRSAGQINLVHVVVIGLSLMLTIGAWLVSKYQIETRMAARFEQSRDQALGLMTDRMKKYEDALWAGVSTIKSHGGDINHTRWRSFANSLRIDEKYPGINGIGLIHLLNDDTFDAYLETRQAERPDFEVYPAHDNPERMPISFIEPVDINAAAVGLDVAHETNRRTAARASRDTGQAQITGPIVLVQDAGHTPGFLFYVPLYQGPAPNTVAERRAQSTGLVYAPFVVRKLMEGLLAKDLRHVRFSIEDAGEVIYDEHSEADALTDPAPMFSETLTLNLYGRDWEIDLRTNLAFRDANTFAQPTVILIAGLIIEVLIVTMLILMARANTRAVAYADKVTVALREKSRKLEDANLQLSDTNEELKEFVYITSHDLKTPIRGIGGLTEIIQEDLEDYFASPHANLEVRENLDLIRSRVQRMNALTRSVIEFSRIGADELHSTPVQISEVIGTLTFDFGLASGQLQLRGNVDIIQSDTLNFRRVLENLVGNAVKYHTDRDKIKIVVTLTNIADRIQVTVEDNGPGIDPKFHDKIFDVFQTLRRTESADSTGIGLAIVKKSVTRNGGKIHVHSSSGKGATFSFDWPNLPREHPVSRLRKAS